MKRLLTAAIALSLLGGTAASAQGYDARHDDHGRYDQRDSRYDRHDDRHDNGHHYGQQKHRWTRGERLPSTYYSSRSHYVDYRRHHLRAPPRGYQWVQVDENYALVALASGLISQIIAGR